MTITHNSKINLNLLRALNALLLEQNVSKAGEKINLTQSAMSLALKQLREIYGDELLVRGQQGKMTLTSFGKTLLSSVQQALFFAEDVFTSRLAFNPKTSNRAFSIGMSDYIAYVILPKLMQSLSIGAPKVRIIQHAVNYLDSTSLFDDIGLDFVIGDFSKAAPSLKTTPLFNDKGIIAADKDHPALREKKLSLKTMLKYPQIFVSLESQPEKNFIVHSLREKGHVVDVSLMTPHTLIALQALPGTMLMTHTVERLVKPFLENLHLAICQPPYSLPSHYTARLYWHIRSQNDPGHQWLRKLLKKITATL
jgi:DNA-binding transcriptional LysR family regulator